MKMIDNFINQYPILKTLRFSLIPVGKTEENFNNSLLLENDKQRAEKYDKVKKYIDRYHKFFISDVLANLYIDEISEYAELYFKSNKSDKELKSMDDLETKMRKKISASFSKDSRFNSLFKKEMIEKILPSFLTAKDEIDNLSAFYGFTTYFTGFHENRKNMYSAEAQTTAISYRCINENLPKFLDNVKKFNIVKEALPSDTMDELDAMVYTDMGFYVNDIFSVDFYNRTLSQPDIDKYNNIIGGCFNGNGVKIKGINEYINLFNHQVVKNDKAKRLPLFTPLYKQILSDREALSFIPESFSDANDLLSAVNSFCSNDLFKCLNDIENLFSDIDSYNTDGIFIATGIPVNEISNAVFGHWDAVCEGWRFAYKEHVPMKKNSDPEKYDKNMQKAFDSKTSFSLNEAQTYGQTFKTDNCPGDIAQYFKNAISDKISAINTNYAEAKNLLSSYYDETIEKKLYKNKKATALLKNLLDSIKDLEHILKCLKGSGKEENKDFLFYGNFTKCYEELTKVDLIYDMVRNFMTQKPYSKDKIKLNFDNSYFLSGWAQSYISFYTTDKIISKSKIVFS